IVLGTAAVPELLRELPRERVIAALDARDGEVVVEGWRQGTGRGIVERMQELNGLVGGYLVTFVEREGSLSGIDMEHVKLRVAVRTRRGVYHSRARGLWIKGATSGDTQELLRVDVDCDRDVLRFTVRQHGRGFCHLHTRTCWGNDRGLTALFRRLQSRMEQ